jgi:hypothetical protein
MAERYKGGGKGGVVKLVRGFVRRGLRVSLVGRGRRE